VAFKILTVEIGVRPEIFVTDGNDESVIKERKKYPNNKLNNK
jgi:hypothetical protein